MNTSAEHSMRYSVLVTKFDGTERLFDSYTSKQEADLVARHFLSLGAAARVEPIEQGVT